MKVIEYDARYKRDPALLVNHGRILGMNGCFLLPSSFSTPL